MYYDIEPNDMEMILDALGLLHKHIRENSNLKPKYPWTADEVDSLFQSFDNSINEE